MSNEVKKSNAWKVIAIVFICLFVVENLLLAWGISWVYEYNAEEIQKTKDCHNDICSEHYDSFYDSIGMCYCYDSEYNIVKSEYIK